MHSSLVSCYVKMEEFLGKRYVLVSYENFEDYLAYLGKGYLARKAALAMRPEQCLTAHSDGSSYSFSFTSALVTTTVTFTLDEEFEEVKPDGVKVKSVVTVEGNKMIHTQIEASGRKSKHVREFFPEKMIVTTTAEGLDKIVTRHYALVR